MRTAIKTIVLSGSLLISTILGVPAHAGVSVNIEIGIGPPAPLIVVSPTPRHGQIWAPGYWRWTGHRYQWVDGYWMNSRPGERWVPDHWEKHDHRYRFQPGRWEHDSDRMERRDERGERGHDEDMGRERGRGHGDRR